MEISKKLFWTEAMKGGSVIGLVVAAFQLLNQRFEVGAWLSMVSLAVFVFLLVVFTRRMASYAGPREGFTYGRCMSFVLAMMLFTGVIVGFAVCLINNFLLKEQVTELVDMQMAALQDMLPQQQFDALYEATYSAMFNPLVLVVVSVVSYCIQGGVIGLFTSVMTQVKPDPFADDNTDTQSDSDYEA